jgi:hypothetical protein
MTNTIESGIFYDRGSADRAVRALHALGYDHSEISVLARDREHAQRFADETGSMAAEGAATGGALGIGIGAIVAGLMATGTVAATAATGGLAGLLVAGPLVAAAAGAGAGGLAGGILGALIGAGIPEERARKYEPGLERGGIVLAVRPKPADEDAVRGILSRADVPNTDAVRI